LNNPFKYTDPTGKCWNFVIAAAIGGTINLISQIASGNIANVGDALKAFGVGALAGLAGAGAGALAGTLVKGATCFITGAISGGASGLAGGVVGGIGNAAINGQSAGDALMAGLKGGAIGALSGGVVGGLSSGINSMAHGGDFWTGEGYTDEINLGASPKTGDVIDWNNNNANVNYDKSLQSTVKTEFDIQKGDMNIQDITTKTPKGYNYKVGGEDYMYNSKGNRIGACVEQVRAKGALFAKGQIVHVSKALLITDDMTKFRSIVGHEFIHVYHHYAFGNSYVDTWSERVAYKYSYDTYMNAGRLTDAANVIYNATTTFSTYNGISYWGSYPYSYSIPSILSIKF
jgi:hypothetical protein